jgi:CubicO group peptidase (beta-lactamase class C family)
MDKLEQAYRAVERSNTENGGLVVISKGYLVFEKYFGKAHRNANPDMASTGKGFTSIACGVMLQEFKAKLPDGLDTKVFTQEFLPEAFPLRDPREADIRLGHLLCMTSGHNGEGPTPSGVIRGTAQPLKASKGQDIRDVDGSSLRVPLWTAPGEGYSYSSPAPHIASMVLRRVTGKELPSYIDEKFAQPMGWGPWGYCLYRGEVTMAHANGAGSIALRSTDAARFGYCLAQGGRWKDQQLIPADYIKLCQQSLPYNPHFPFSLQFEHNQAGQIVGARVGSRLVMTRGARFGSEHVTASCLPRAPARHPPRCRREAPRCVRRCRGAATVRSASRPRWRPRARRRWRA